jgi:hypothetical protein
MKRLFLLGISWRQKENQYKKRQESVIKKLLNIFHFPSSKRAPPPSSFSLSSPTKMDIIFEGIYEGKKNWLVSALLLGSLMG